MAYLDDHPTALPDDSFPEQRLRSGELASLVGVSTDTLRHYERKGVLPRPERLANGYRSYPPQALARVRLIRAALTIGFTLDELAPLLRARQQGRPPCRRVRELAAQKLQEAQRQLDQLVAHVSALQGLIADWDERLADAADDRPLGLLEAITTPLDTLRVRPASSQPDGLPHNRRNLSRRARGPLPSDHKGTS